VVIASGSLLPPQLLRLAHQGSVDDNSSPTDSNIYVCFLKYRSVIDKLQFAKETVMAIEGFFKIPYILAY